MTQDRSEQAQVGSDEPVPEETHRRLTVHWAAFHALMLTSAGFRSARAIFGTTSEADDSRLYKAIQAYLYASPSAAMRSEREACAAFLESRADQLHGETQSMHATLGDWVESQRRGGCLKLAADMLRKGQPDGDPHGECAAEIAKLRAAAAKSERRAIMFGDIVHSQVLAMQAAVIDGHLTTPEDGLQWIVNTLAGPGNLPDLEEARSMGGAQAWFDRETAAHDAFRVAHPAPTLVQRPIDDADRYAFAKTLEGQVVVMETFKRFGAEALDQALDDAIVEGWRIDAIPHLGGP